MKRRVMTILVFMLIGAVVNVAVGIAFATRAPINDFRMFAPTRNEVELWRGFVRREDNVAFATRSSVTGLEYKQITGALAPNQFRIKVNKDGLTVGTSSEGFPSNEFAKIVVCLRSGWPAMSLRGVRHEPRPVPGEQPGGRTVVHFDRGSFTDDSWLERVPSESSSFYGAIPVRVAPGGHAQHRMLPLMPIWPGFAINTLFYAVILWLLFAAPFALRRRIRIRRGLCPACAYPIGESGVCTECGKAVMPRRGDGL